MKPLFFPILASAIFAFGLSRALGEDPENSNDSLQAKPATLVEWLAQPNRLYQVESSNNLASWQPAGMPLLGTGKRESRTFELTPERRFWRVRAESVPLIPWLEGVWRGLVYQPGQGTSNYITRLTVSSDTGTYAVEYDFGGGADLVLVSYSDSEATFALTAENIKYGPVGTGTIYLRKGNENQILYNWANTERGLVESSFGVLNLIL